MISTFAATDDRERVAAVHRYNILDTPPDGSFDRITALAARLFEVQIAIVSIVDEDRIWFKSQFGLGSVHEIPRDPGLCASAIDTAGPYVVESADTDPRTLANPLVAGDFGLRFYAAAPLETHDGFRLGTLCLLDRRARRISRAQQQMLEMLAGIVMDQMELRLRAMQTVSAERALRNDALGVAATLQQEMLPRRFPAVPGVRFDATYVPAGTESIVGGDWYDAFLLDEDHVVLSIGDVAGHGLPAATLMGALRQSLRAFALSERSPRKLLALLDTLLRSEHDDAIVTAFVALLDLRNKRLSYANAGHPPPFLRLPNRELRELVGTGLPLGLRTESEPEDIEIVLETQSTLVLYTDGVTEVARNIIEGERNLKRALAKPAFDTAARPAHVLCEELLPHSPRDDAAIMCLSFD